MSQGRLAAALGINQSRISEYEQGGLRLHGAMIVALSRILGASTDEILGLKKTKTQRPKRSRLARRLERIEELPSAERRAVLKILDSLLEKHGRNGRA